MHSFTADSLDDIAIYFDSLADAKIREIQGGRVTVQARRELRAAADTFHQCASILRATTILQKKPTRRPPSRAANSDGGPIKAYIRPRADGKYDICASMGGTLLSTWDEKPDAEAELTRISTSRKAPNT